MQFIKDFLRRFPHALAGIWYGVRHDRSIKHQFLGGALAVVVLAYLAHPLTGIELLLLLLCWGLILITELQNSAIEAALDQLHPERHPAIKKSKDMAAGAVLMAGTIFAITGFFILLT